MGQEIGTTQWSEADFGTFVARLKAETDWLLAQERSGAMSEAPASFGMELEACLVDAAMQPAPHNLGLLDVIGHPLVVPELSRCNIEFNCDPVPAAGTSLSALEGALAGLWAGADRAARDAGLNLLACGILPTLTDDWLTTAAMTPGNRYVALNDHVFRLRKGAPIRLAIDGVERLDGEHRDVMLEAGTTSCQFHLTVPASRSADWFNAAKLAAVPLVALAANAPFLFGRNLWAETRIPLFEQAVSVGDWDYAERVTYGVRFIEDGMGEVFLANRQRYPVLLPILSDAPVEALAHLKLHNGTIWRWVRPIVGRDADGRLHYRIEMRVVPAGPSLGDSIASAAFFFGLTAALASAPPPPHDRCQFFTARDNFYAAARLGLEAQVRWDHRDGWPLDRLILDALLPLAEAGLGALGVDGAEAAHYLGLIADRVSSGQTGAAWQRRWVDTHGRDMAGLTAAMLERQRAGEPVHRWSV